MASAEGNAAPQVVKASCYCWEEPEDFAGEMALEAAHEGLRLLAFFEPDWHPAAKQYKAALAAEGIPLASFQVADVLDDTCGNLIHIVTPANTG